MLDDPEADAIICDRISGKTMHQIARERGMTVPEANRMLDLAAQRAFSPEGLQRTLLIEVERLNHLKHELWTHAMAGDRPAAALYVKAAERLSAMLGLNAPNGHLVMVTSTLAPTDTATSTERMLQAIRLLRGETAPAADQDDEPDDGDG